MQVQNKRIDIFYRSSLNGFFYALNIYPTNIYQAREIIHRLILSHLEYEDRGDEYVAGWISLAESSLKADICDVFEFDEVAYKISRIEY